MGLEPGDPVAPDAPFAVMNGTQNYLGKAWTTAWVARGD